MAEENQRQREKETEDLINQRYVKAEAEKQRKLKAMSVTTSDRESQYLIASQKTLIDKHKLADEEKKKKLEAYSRIAAGGPARSDEAAKTSTSVTKKEEISSGRCNAFIRMIWLTMSLIAYCKTAYIFIYPANQIILPLLLNHIIEKVNLLSLSKYFLLCVYSNNIDLMHSSFINYCIFLLSAIPFSDLL